MKKCINCGMEFEGYFNQKYCSKTCRDDFTEHKQKRTCAICGVEFIGGRKTKYCSSCKVKAKKTRKCDFCNKEYELNKNNKNSKFCSVKCSNASRKNGKYLPCDNCGKIVYFKEKELVRSKTHFCSHKCHDDFLRYTGNKNEYVKRNQKREHRVVMEEYLGRNLLPDEHIHHKNGNKHDNRIENLMILSPSEHAKLHAELRKKKKHGEQIV